MDYHYHNRNASDAGVMIIHSADDEMISKEISYGIIPCVFNGITGVYLVCIERKWIYTSNPFSNMFFVFQI